MLDLPNDYADKFMFNVLSAYEDSLRTVILEGAERPQKTFGVQLKNLIAKDN